MNTASTGGYISDIDYVAEFYGDHAPGHFNLIAATNGFPGRALDRPFTWCDYGCGNGVSAVVIAACYPDSQFYGIDFLPSHIRTAQTLALRGGVDNATFLEKNFATLGSDDVPPLDYAVMHGILSWVDDATRAAVLDDVAKRLKPGGLLFTGTNAMPGWAARLPMRNMMYSLTQDDAGSLERAQVGLEWLKKLKTAQAKYFRDNPALADVVNEMERLDPRYIAHEYFNQHLRAFYFTELQALMEPHGLKFAGCAKLFLNFVDLAVPALLRDEFRQVKSRTELEAKRDFIRNETFRRDVWIKGTGVASEDEWIALQQDLIFGTLDPLAKIDRRVAFGDIELSYEGAPFAPILDVYAQNAVRLSRATDIPALKALPPAIALEATRLLAAGGQVTAFPKETRPTKVGSKRIALPAINRMLINELAPRGRVVPLAALDAGTGITLRNTDALLLQAICEQGRNGAIDATLKLMSELGAVKVSGKTLSASEIGKLLNERLAHFDAGFLDKLAEIGAIIVSS